MTLSGNLGFVPLDEILRLLTRSKQQGAVEVTGNGVRGRVFVGKGGIDLATTTDDDVLHRHLVNSGYAEESTLRRVTTGETTLAALAESNHEIVELLREMTVESIYQISDQGGDFHVKEGKVSPYASPKSFDLETLLEDAQERSREWAKVSEVVPDLSAAIGLRRDLGDREEVSVKSDDWKILSEIGNGKSVQEIADQLGTTEFWTARVVARLASNELVELRVVEPETEWTEPSGPIAEPSHEERSYEEPSYQSSYQEDPYETAEATAEPTEVEAEQPQEIFNSETAERDDERPAAASWWQEPQAEVEEIDEDHAPEVVSEGLSEMPSVGPVESPEEAEEDTEAFLEKVFSELDSDKSDTDEGHGLLRRRRMGTL
ncbi:MAG TPA: DUF4388 domain-containing protein, partial [Acidimicrobiia bacterium]